jgi:hypothetical protein
MGEACMLMISLPMRYFIYREAWDRMKMNVVLSLVLIYPCPAILR